MSATPALLLATEVMNSATRDGILDRGVGSLQVDMHVLRRVDISIMLMCDASGIVEYE